MTRMIRSASAWCAASVVVSIALTAGVALAQSGTSRAASSGAATPYNPLAINKADALPPLDFTIEDVARKRQIPVRVYRPRSSAPAPVLLFSHGLGGARTNNAYLGEHWAARGYVAVFLQHIGSDESVWQNAGPARAMMAMRKAANAENFMLRVADVPAVLNTLTTWNTESGHALSGKLDLTRVGMSGHSFGAVTTQAVSGQKFPMQRAQPRDPRIDAALILSPSVPERGDARAAFGSVDMPWLLMTGTEDVARIGGASLDDRLGVYPALPNGSKYELVLYNAEHSAFGDRALPGDTNGQRNPNHHRAILALSTAFWDAYLRNDAGARAWLDGDAARSVLEAKDRWQHK
jgi:predicted dienelactone hydrolase